MRYPVRAALRLGAMALLVAATARPVAAQAADTTITGARAAMRRMQLAPRGGRDVVLIADSAQFLRESLRCPKGAPARCTLADDRAYILTSRGRRAEDGSVLFHTWVWVNSQRDDPKDGGPATVVARIGEDWVFRLESGKWQGRMAYTSSAH